MIYQQWLLRLGALIITHLCRMLLEATPFIGFTMGAVVVCCALFKRLED